MVKPEKKYQIPTPCKSGNHNFIVSSWLTSGGKKKAIAMLCQNCLMPMDLVEMENAKWFKKED